MALVAALGLFPAGAAFGRGGVGVRSDTPPTGGEQIRPVALRPNGTTRQVELRDRQFVQPASCCVNTTAYLSPSGA